MPYSAENVLTVLLCLCSVLHTHCHHFLTLFLFFPIPYVYILVFLEGSDFQKTEKDWTVVVIFGYGVVLTGPHKPRWATAAFLVLLIHDDIYPPRLVVWLLIVLLCSIVLVFLPCALTFIVSTYSLHILFIVRSVLPSFSDDITMNRRRCSCSLIELLIGR